MEHLVGGSGIDQIRDFDFQGEKITCVGKTSSSDLVTKVKASAINANDTTFGGPNWDGFIFEFEFLPLTNSFRKNWLTYLGGDNDEELNACKFDAAGNLFVVGESASSDMTIITPPGAYSQNFNTGQLGATNAPLSTDGIIGKFDAGTSAKSWFTFFGTDALGTNAHTNAGDYFYGLTTAGNNVYVCGKAGGTNMPDKVNNKMNAGDFDGILVHFTTGGALNNSKFTDGNIVNYAVKERWGDVYTAGQAKGGLATANSRLFYFNGTLSGASDACFSIHDQNLTTATIHNSYLGGNGEDAAYDVQFNTNNSLYIAGGTNSSNFPVTSLGNMYAAANPQNNSLYLNDNFIAVFEKGNAGITWSSCLGSPLNESLTYPPYFNSQVDIANTTIALDDQNTLRVLGTSNSYNNFPLDDGGGIPFFKPNNGGFGNDATITCFDAIELNAIVGLEDFKNTQFSFGLYPNPTQRALRSQT